MPKRRKTVTKKSRSQKGVKADFVNGVVTGIKDL